MTGDYWHHASQIIRRILEATGPLTPCSECGLVIHDVAEWAHKLGFDRDVAVQMAEHLTPLFGALTSTVFRYLTMERLGYQLPVRIPSSGR